MLKQTIRLCRGRYNPSVSKKRSRVIRARTLNQTMRRNAKKRVNRMTELLEALKEPYVTYQQNVNETKKTLSTEEMIHMEPEIKKKTFHGTKKGKDKIRIVDNYFNERQGEKEQTL